MDFLRPGLKTGVGNGIFWSEIGSGFGNAGGTPPPKFQEVPPPPRETFIQKILEILEIKRLKLCIIDCVAFFYEKGRGGEYYQSKNNFRSSAPSEERRPSKLQNLQDINPTSQLLTLTGAAVINRGLMMA